MFLIFLFDDSGRAQSGSDPGARPAPTRLIVKLKNLSTPNFSKADHQTVASDIEFHRLNERYGVSVSQPLVPGVSNTHEALEAVQLLSVSGSVDLRAMARDYDELSCVEYAEADNQMELFAAPNDPLYTKQWSLHNSGQSYWHVLRQAGTNNDELVADSGIVGADIGADAVLANPPDRTAVIVAVIDTGIDFKHPDLAGQIWTNPREIPDNGIDDDHNGYIDDVHGWDYSANDTSMVPVYSDNDPTDHHGHGTHVAGVIAATADNGIGIAGISSHCRIMPLKFYPIMFSSSAARAIVYAADNGAEVINMSWGSPFPSRLIEDALNYARSKGVVLCAATGNSGKQDSFYPAALPNIIAVGATDSRDHVTVFSTCGPQVDVVAPGESILSLRAEATDMYALKPSQEPNVHIIETDYYEASGTSMACPHVVAIAGYLKSVSLGLTPTMVQTVIQSSAKDIKDPYGTGASFPGRDDYSGYGRVNLQQALTLVPAIRARIESPLPNQFVSGVVSVDGVADGAGFEEYTLEYGSGSNPAQWQQLRASTTPVTQAALASWDSDTLDGCFTLRLRVGEVNESQVKVYVTNHEHAQILSPREGDTLSAATIITGSVSARDFNFATLEYAERSAPTEWRPIDTLTAPVFGDRLLEWNTSALVEGNYELRLSLPSSHGPLSDTVSIYVRSPFSGRNGWRLTVGGVATIVPNYGDFDGDGRTEIVVGTSAGVQFYDADGKPKTSGMPTLPGLNFRTPIAVGHLDDDGIDDFVAVSDSPPLLFISRSKSGVLMAALPESPRVATFDGNAEEKLPVVFLEDINHDGRDEIHYQTAFDTSTLGSNYYIRRSDGTPWPARQEYANVQMCLPADLDNDQIDEIYCYDDSLREYDLNGVEQASILLHLLTRFRLKGMSAVDIDNDGKRELMVFGRYPWSHNLETYWLFAFGEHLILKNGWPRELPISHQLLPSMPIFGDIDGDTLPECVATCWDLNYGYVYAWRNNGKPYEGDSTSSGFFASVPMPSMLNMPIMADIDAANGAEIIGCALPDAWMTSFSQSIVAWNKSAQVLTGWPLTVAYSPNILLDYANTPVVGDINQDGNVDMMMTTALGDLVFVNFPDRPLNTDKLPCPIWRYNRRLNNIAPLSPKTPTAVVDESGQGAMPEALTLWQNYPNPFNNSTVISFALARSAPVKIDILNILGQVVKSLGVGVQSVGVHAVEWDGTDRQGVPVSSGVYFYRVSVGDRSLTRKLILLK